jgi:hypothetical protein
VGVTRDKRRLLIGFLQPTLLNKRDDRLEGFAPFDADGRALSNGRRARVNRLRRGETEVP